MITYELNFLNKYYDKLKIENGFTIKYKFDDIERVNQLSTKSYTNLHKLTQIYK